MARRCEVGYHGLVTSDGTPRVVPLNFSAIGQGVFFHGALAGEKIDLTRCAPRVSFLMALPYGVIPSCWLAKGYACDALSCPRCSTREQSVPMVVLAFLTDPAVVGKILLHLGLPTTAPLVARARSSGKAKGFELFAEERASGDGAGESDGEWASGPERGPPG